MKKLMGELMQCPIMIDEEWAIWSKDHTEIIGTKKVSRHCHQGGRFKFSDGKILCWSHAQKRTLMEGIDQGEILDIYKYSEGKDVQ